jgi:hypothetical protein
MQEFLGKPEYRVYIGARELSVERNDLTRHIENECLIFGSKQFQNLLARRESDLVRKAF